MRRFLVPYLWHFARSIRLLIDSITYTQQNPHQSQIQRNSMENRGISKAPKQRRSFGNVLSPLNINLSSFVACGGRRHSPMSDPYASDTSSSHSPLMKYLRSPASVSAPVNTEDDVIVMDGIPVLSSNRGGGGGGGGVGPRLSRTSSDSGSGGGGRSRSETTTSSSGSGGRLSGGEVCMYKAWMCPTWEICGTCRYGSQCQFAHSKEELAPYPHFSGKIRPEIVNLYTSTEGSSPSSYRTKHPLTRAAEAFSLSSIQTQMALPTPIHVKQSSASTTSSGTIPDTSYTSSRGSSSSSSGTKHPLNKAAEPFSSPTFHTRASIPTTPIHLKKPSESNFISSPISNKSYTSSEGSNFSSSRTKYPLNIAAEPFSSPTLQTRTSVPTTPIQVQKPSESPVSSTTISNKSYTSSEGSNSSSSGTKSPLNIAAEPFSSPTLQTQNSVPTTPIQVKIPSESIIISSKISDISYTSSEGSRSSSAGTKYPFNIAAEPFSSPTLQIRAALPTTPLEVKNSSVSTVIRSNVPSTKLPTTPIEVKNSPVSTVISSNVSSPKLPTTPIEVKNSPVCTVISSNLPSSKLPISDWIPQDDDIQFLLPSIDNPSREDVNANMLDLLYGTSLKKRLPVFEEICPE